ncbi:hypothetical protein B0H63DRAFT_468299 [Podospora didyma]|uniref:Immunoglobulin variable region used by the itc63b heavy chain n=1 Tax=Podospora didyma TaxID=330526 RepID=A0AAE0U0V4_9PEZI|nr:hypothetical protein B0H63DRAFT_468299 [Podospora didyma]
MEDAVCPSRDALLAAFGGSFRAWSTTVPGDAQRDCERAFRALEKLASPATFPNLPSFPNPLTPTEKSGDYFASGESLWDAGDCPSCDLGVTRRRLRIRVSATRPVPIDITTNTTKTSAFPDWFGSADNHVSVLVLAWAYILSARWQEIVTGPPALRYTPKVAPPASQTDKPQVVHVHIGNVTAQAQRWWEAVLAPDNGWAALICPGSLSPWAICLPSSPRFAIVSSPPTTHSSTLPKVASFAEASRYLLDYCILHGIVHKSWAALSAALFLPLANWERSRIRLPVSGLPSRTIPKVMQRPPNAGQPCPTSQLDKLLLLSCHVRGLSAVLSSIFFNPDIPCNLASPWLQGAFAVIDNVSHDRHRLATTLIDRNPEIGFLWIGAMITGQDKRIIDCARGSGTDLHSAIWTGTVQNFIQLPPPSSAVSNGRINRADECRLLFLASDAHSPYLPMSPWKPFGSTDLEDTDLEVRLHVKCRGHRLRYRGWSWSGTKGTIGATSNSHTPGIPSLRQSTNVTIPYDVLDLEDNDASANATYNAFRWLRMEGFSAAEQHIRRHEWVCDYFDDDEAEGYESHWTSDEDKKRAKSAGPNKPKLAQWLTIGNSVDTK